MLKLLPVLCECVSLCGGSMPFYPDFHEVPPVCRAVPCMLLKLLEALLERSQLLERGCTDMTSLRPLTRVRVTAMLQGSTCFKARLTGACATACNGCHQVVMERLRSRRTLSREMRNKLKKSMMALPAAACAPGGRSLRLVGTADGGDTVILGAAR